MREYVINDNLARRHLTTEQKAALALEDREDRTGKS